MFYKWKLGAINAKRVSGKMWYVTCEFERIGTYKMDAYMRVYRS